MSYEEPTLALGEIQASILFSFAARPQLVEFLRVTDLDRFRRGLGRLAAGITTAGELAGGVRDEDRGGTARVRQAGGPWTNIALSHGLIARLASDAEKFRDKPFRQGLAARSAELGDPSDPQTRGHASTWLVGGPECPADVVVILAASRRCELRTRSHQLQHELGARSVLRDYSTPPRVRGVTHEHFGFRDEVSQPQLRGRMPDLPEAYLIPRDRNHPDLARGARQPMVWPGEFIFGYAGQNPEHLTRPGLDRLANEAPAWAENGSFLVARRLHQDVYTYHRFLAKTVSALGVSAETIAARMMGRWPGGAPLVQTNDVDGPMPDANANASNDFLFHGYEALQGTPFDPLGEQCPFSAHIRKMNPRDVRSHRGNTFPNPMDTQRHRLIRRGIPYGRRALSTAGTPMRDEVDRGLLFLCYQTSIEEQFEFVVRRWANEPNFPSQHLATTR